VSDARDYVAAWADLVRRDWTIATPARTDPVAVPSASPACEGVPHCVVISPHPDDECIQAGWPLRLAREAGWRITNLAVTFGSRQERRFERLRELEAACARLGFTLIRLDTSDRLGLDDVTLAGRHSSPDRWQTYRDRLSGLLADLRPDLVIAPHRDDAHPTHRGTHQLLHDALRDLHDAGAALPRTVAHTEYWSPVTEPNLLVQLDEETVAKMLEALAEHRGEITRNPYHRTLPAWLVDNVRRGSERVLGAGAGAACGIFGVLLELGRMIEGRWHRDSVGRSLPLTLRADTTLECKPRVDRLADRSRQ